MQRTWKLLVLTFVFALIGVAHAGEVATISRRANDLEYRREIAVKALMMLQFSNWHNGPERQVAYRQLLSLGMSRDAISNLVTALGSKYGTPKPGFEMLIVPTRVRTEDYDRELARAADAAGLGTDFRNYLYAARPALVEGRLKTTDALEPRFLKQNLATLKDLIQHDLRPYEPQHDFLKDYVHAVSPQAWKDPEWRASIKEILMNGTPAELERFSLAASPNAYATFRAGAPYRTLVWGLGDVYKEAVGAANSGPNADPLRAGSLAHLASSFPPNGPQDFVKGVLSPSKSEGALNELADIRSTALGDYYLALTKELQSPRTRNLDPAVAKKLVDWFQKRAGNRILSVQDTDLLEHALPKAHAVVLDDPSYPLGKIMEKLESEMNYFVGWSDAKKNEFRERIREAQARASLHPESQARVLELLQSSDPKEIARGLIVIENTQIGTGHAGIQTRLAEVFREIETPGSALAKMSREKTVDAMVAVIHPGQPVDGKLAERLLNSGAIHPSVLSRLRPEDVSFDPGAYETLATSPSYDSATDAWRKETATSMKTRIPEAHVLASLDLTTGGEPAQSYILRLLNSKDPDEVIRGLKLCERTPAILKSHEIQSRLVTLHTTIAKLPRLSSRLDNQDYLLESIFGRIGGKEPSVIDPSVLKLLRQLPPSRTQEYVLRRIEAKTISGKIKTTLHACAAAFAKLTSSY